MILGGLEVGVIHHVKEVVPILHQDGLCLVDNKHLNGRQEVVVPVSLAEKAERWLVNTRKLDK